MCGIAGFTLAPRDRVDASRLASRLLLGIENRGRHATGAGWYDPDTGKAYVDKAAIPASQYVKFMALPDTTRTAVLHTRWASQGSPSNNGNNHPVDVAGAIGVHNGVIHNDRDVFGLLRGYYERRHQVDSEAIFALIRHSGLDVTEALPLLTGSAAIAWLDTDDPTRTLHLARISSSPLVVGRTAAGSVVFASTIGTVTAAAADTGLTLTDVTTLDEGVYQTYRATDTGVVAGETRFATERDRFLTATERKALDLV